MRHLHDIHMQKRGMVRRTMSVLYLLEDQTHRQYIR